MSIFVGAIWMFVIMCTVIGGFAVVRLRQFSNRNQFLNYGRGGRPYVIVMLDFYRDSPELYARIHKTCDLYFQLKQEGLNPRVLLTTGILKGEKQSLATSNAEDLINLGIPRSRINVYLGDRLLGKHRFSRKEQGAADTYEEVLLACEWLRCHDISSAYVVTNFPQAFHAHFIAMFQKIYLNPVLVSLDLLDNKRAYSVAKLFQAILLLFDPMGRNPLSMAMRVRRRYFSNNV